MKRHRPLASSIVTAAIVLGANYAFAICGDVNGDGRVSSTDALAVLHEAIGEHDGGMMCDPCDGHGTTTTTLGDGATSYTLRVDKQGMHSGDYMHMDGNGRVTSEPTGIDCGDDCSAAFDAGLDVTLTAVPDSDSDFIGWSGDVPSECYYSGDPCTVTMTRNREVHAMFMPDDYGMPHH